MRSSRMILGSLIAVLAGMGAASNPTPTGPELMPEADKRRRLRERSGIGMAPDVQENSRRIAPVQYREYSSKPPMNGARECARRLRQMERNAAKAAKRLS